MVREADGRRRAGGGVRTVPGPFGGSGGGLSQRDTGTLRGTVGGGRGPAVEEELGGQQLSEDIH